MPRSSTGTAKYASREREQKDVVERQRAFDQVNGRPLVGRPTRQGDPRGDGAGDQYPADAPGDRLAAPGLPAGREQAELDDQTDDDSKRRGEDEDEFPRRKLLTP